MIGIKTVSKNIGFIFKVVNGYDILVNRIIQIWYVEMIWFLRNFDVFKIGYCIISSVSKNPVINKFKACFWMYLKTLCKFVNFLNNIHAFGVVNFWTAIRKYLVNFIIVYLNWGDGIKTYVRKTVVAGMIIATF